MANRTAALRTPGAARLALWARRHRLGRKSAVVLAVMSLGSALVTYAALSGSLPFASDPRALLLLLNVDLVLFLALGAIVARRLVRIWIARRRGFVGARLHGRLVLWFSVIAGVPAITVSVFSALFFSLGVQAWFSDRVQTALEEASIVAESYLREHQKVIRGDILAIARDINRSAPQLWVDPARFNQMMAAQGVLRNLSEAYVFDSAGQVIARWNLSFVLDRDPIPVAALEKVERGELVVLASGSEDRMRAIVKLDGVINAFLYISRFVEPRVLDHIARTRRTVAEYRSLEGQRQTFEITFAMMFVLVALLLLMAAIWAGLSFASRLAGPVTALAAAAERVRGGDLSTRVPETGEGDEIGSLTRAFNRMTGQLEAQRDELLEANRQLDTRRNFIETVLSGVSAGVVGLDRAGNVNVSNRLASELLFRDLDRSMGRPLAALAPRMGALLAEARNRPDRAAETEIELKHGDGTRTLFVRVVADLRDEAIVGFVVTFNDITELLAAQRKAAWSDVARRIAHEIKNPLTPIQLSAERLRRKYLGEISSDPKSFDDYTETIIRHVGDIGRMVDEFSDFARMPNAVIAPVDIADLCRVELALYREAHPRIAFEAALPDDPPIVACDAGLATRALSNLLKNAVEAIEARGDGAAPGRIAVSVEDSGGFAVVSVEDNGRGLPDMASHRLTEPYVTTRDKGTGLGLAIVRKIMEDHNGEVVLEAASGGGARVRLVFPKDGQGVTVTR
ncbi:MAG: PAS domain-containing sensor histidine kinase [Defluviicoccus sp.]|nr:PAS domain-containing sensor histidine kinase [Defluviicoccus sp.]